MSISGDWLRRQIVHSLVVLLAVPVAVASTAQRQPAVSDRQATGAPSVQAQPQNSNPAPPPTAGQSGVNSAATAGQSDAGQQQSGTPNPVGTAAAPDEKTTGAAASRPAGAVIAPAKQKRAHSLLIKVGLILGAAVAIGTVAGLSAASSSRPH